MKPCLTGFYLIFSYAFPLHSTFHTYFQNLKGLNLFGSAESIAASCSELIFLNPYFSKANNSRHEKIKNNVPKITRPLENDLIAKTRNIKLPDRNNFHCLHKVYFAYDLHLTGYFFRKMIPTIMPTGAAKIIIYKSSFNSSVIFFHSVTLALT